MGPTLVWVLSALDMGVEYSFWISTLPLNKKGIILHPDIVSMVFEFSPGERFRQNIYILIFYETEAT